MGTRSTIAIRNTDGTFEAIYCHWDGYLSHNGRILEENYTTEEKVRELIALGDISSQGKKLAPSIRLTPIRFLSMLAQLGAAGAPHMVAIAARQALHQRPL